MNESICVNGLNIFGSPYSVVFGNWWFMQSEKELKEIYSAIPDNTDIILTHTPSFEKLDFAISGENAGSISLSNRIEQLKNLKYHIAGHIHEGYGIMKENNITYLNVSLLDERYRLVNTPVEIYIED